MLDRFAENAQANGMQMAREGLDLLRQIRDQTGEGTAARETGFSRPFGVDIVGGIGQTVWNLPGGVGVQLSSIAATLPGPGGRISVYTGGPSAASLAKTVDVPGAAVNGVVAKSDTFGPSDYVPEQALLTIVAEGIGADGRATIVIRGKMFIVGDAMDTTHGGT